MTAWSDPVLCPQVSCPRCSAGPGEACRDRRGRAARGWVHSERDQARRERAAAERQAPR